jgi:PAS domain S-box-containing protein
MHVLFRFAHLPLPLLILVILAAWLAVPDASPDGLGSGLVILGLAQKTSPRRRADAAEARAALYQTLVEYTADPIYMLDPHDGFRMVFANDACRRHYGLDYGALYALRLPDWDPNFQADQLATLWQDIKASKFRTLETEHQLPDGRRIPVEVSINYLVHQGREYVAGYFRDISDRKRIENALRESEARFRAMADAAPVLIWLADTDKRCIWFNQGWLEFTGRTLDQEFGHGWTEGVHPDDFNRCVAIYTLNFDARRPFRMEYRLRRRDGVYRWILDAGRPRFHDNGDFCGYIGSCIDITDHKDAELSLARSRHELAAVVGALDDLVLEVDSDYKFRNCWGNDEQKLFLPPSAFLGRTIGEVFPGDFAQPFIEAIAAVLAGNGPKLLDYPSPVPGDSRWFNARISQLCPIGDTLPSVVLVIRDVTERIEIDRMKSDFLSTAAHELRTPMASIYGFAELLLSADDFDEATRREMLGIIFRQSKLITALVNELLDLARIEARKGKDFVFGPLDICALTRKPSAPLLDNGKVRYRSSYRTRRNGCAPIATSSGKPWAMCYRMPTNIHRRAAKSGSRSSGARAKSASLLAIKASV